jgi:hypothetical protein
MKIQEWPSSFILGQMLGVSDANRRAGGVAPFDEIRASASQSERGEGAAKAIYNPILRSRAEPAREPRPAFQKKLIYYGCNYSAPIRNRTVITHSLICPLIKLIKRIVFSESSTDPIKAVAWPVVDPPAHLLDLIEAPRQQRREFDLLGSQAPNAGQLMATAALPMHGLKQSAA